MRRKLPLLGEWDIPVCILSTLQWRKMNGEIILYTDSDGARMLEEMNLIDLWNDVNTSILDRIDPDRFDPKFFWCTPKFKVFQQVPQPFVYLDFDLIAWEEISGDNQDLRFLHLENTRNEAYQSKNGLQIKPEFKLNPAWNLKKDIAFNVACLYFGNDEFKNAYCRHALDFIDGHKIRASYGSQIMNLSGFSPEIVFVEQTLLRVLADFHGIKTSPFIDAVYDVGRWDFIRDDPTLGRWCYHRPDPSSRFTHVWMYKHAVKTLPMIKAEYVRTLLQSLLTFFPEQIIRLQQISALGPYLDDPLFQSQRT